MQKITPHLWFDKEAKEAAEFYTSFLPDSKVTNITTLHDTPSGDCDVVSFELAGQPFMAISAGPLFKFNPSVSFHVKCKTKEEVDAIWEKLSSGGKVLMPLDAYPFSERYGWIEDKYGLSWQVIYAGNNEIQQTITPVLMFVGTVCGKTEEAVTFYTSVFHNANTFFLTRYGKGEEPDKQGTVQYVAFTLEGMEFGAMDSARDHHFAFNEAISFLVPCDTQAEIDYYWEKLSADPQAEQCGWLKDKFGLSWQIWPTAIGEMMKNGTREQIDRITQAFLPMKKFDLATLQRAYEGKER
ncbi:MAG: VOC family protein [Chloroflexi bacterium]|nr:MAG: VOC family protein [Chloroflexota bacterium]